MIFATRDRSERPLFIGYVNNITERQLPSGGTMKIFTIGTNEKKQDETKEYSSWFCNLIGNARKEQQENPLGKGDRIEVYGFKMTNVSRKQADGSWGRPYLNVSISDYVKSEPQTQNSEPEY